MVFATAQGLAGSAFVRPPQARTSRTSARAVERDLWCPGLPAPAWLDGSLPGDCGFDPAELAKDPDTLRWMVQAELIHARLAMMAVGGIMGVGIINKIGGGNLPEWYDAGKVAIQGSTIPFGSLLALQLVLTGFVETKRWMDYVKPGSQAEEGIFLGMEKSFSGIEGAYPGGLFDPFGFTKNASEAKLKDLKQKEINNGRVSMLAFVGFVSQSVVTKKGPIDNLLDHLADPAHNNFATNGVSLPFLYLKSPIF